MKGALSEKGAQAEERDARLWRIVYGVVSSLVLRPAGFFVTLIAVPLVAESVGKSLYGSFEVALTVSTFASLGGLGTNLVLTNLLTDCYVSRDSESARANVSNLLGAALVGSFVAFIATSAVLTFVDVHTLFGLAPAHASMGKALLIVAVGAGLLAAVSTLSTSIYGAYQEPHKNNLWDAAGKMFTILTVWLAARAGLGLIGLAAAYMATAGVVRGLNLALLLYVEKPFLAPRLRDVDGQSMLHHVKGGAAFLALQFASMAVVQSDRLVIKWTLGVDELGSYAAVSRLLLTAYSVVLLVLTPLWPAHGEAMRRGDVAWVKRTVTVSLVLGVSLVVACGGALVLFQKQVLTLWLKSDAFAVPTSIVLALTLTFVSRVWIDARSVVLNSVNVIKPQFILLIANALLYALLARLVAGRFGLVGVAWALPVSSLVTTFVGYPLLLRKVLSERSSR